MVTSNRAFPNIRVTANRRCGHVFYTLCSKLLLKFKSSGMEFHAELLNHWDKKLIHSAHTHISAGSAGARAARFIVTRDSVVRSMPQRWQHFAERNA
jgi:hypothetical protein